jgi:hypothetical protein
MLSRFRSAWLSQNLVLIVLRLLTESSLTEWEILSILHSRYGLDPTAREFGRLGKELVGGGYALLESGNEGGKLQITSAGISALRRLEEEYLMVVANAVQSQGGNPGGFAPRRRDFV